MDVSAVFKERKDLVNVLSMVATICEEAVFNFDPDSVWLSVLDPSRTASIYLSMQKGFFETLEVPEARNFKIGNLDNLLKILKKFEDGQVTMKYVESEERVYLSQTSPVGSKSWVATLQIGEEDAPRIPKVDLPNEVVIEREGLLKTLEKLEITNQVRFRLIVDAHSARFVGSDEFESKLFGFEGSFRTLDDPTHKVTLEEGASSVQCTYSRVFLQDILKGIESDLVSLNFRKDYPMRVSLREPDLEVSYWIAPFIEGDR